MLHNVIARARAAAAARGPGRADWGRGASALDAAVAKGLLREGSSDRRAVLLWAALRGVAEIKKLEQHDKHTFDEAVLFDIALHSLLRGWGGDDELLAKAHDLTLNILGDNA